LTAKLCNNILVKKGMSQISPRSLLTKLKSNSYKNKGVLYVVEILKNDSNLEDGHTINFDTPTMKKSLAESFNIEGNRTLIKLIKEYDLKYPKFKENLMQILNNGA